MSHNNEQRLTDSRAEYRTSQRVTFFRSVGFVTFREILTDNFDHRPAFFGWFLTSEEVGKFYHLGWSDIIIKNIIPGDLDMINDWNEITRAEFDRLLQRYILPPVFGDAP